MSPRRHVIGPLVGLLLSGLAATVLVLIIISDLFIVTHIGTETPLPLSVRIPMVGVYQESMTGGPSYRLMRINQERGKTVDPSKARMIRAHERRRRPPGKGLIVGICLAAALLFFLFTNYLRNLGGTAGLLRTHVVLLGSVLLLAASTKVMLVTTAWSPLWAPLAAIVIPVSLCLGQRVTAATTMVTSIAIGLLTPIDFVVLVVFAVQGMAIAASIRQHSPWRNILYGTVAAAVGGFLSYASLSLLMQQFVHTDGLTSGAFDVRGLLDSDLVASSVGPLASGFAAFAVLPLLQLLLQQVSRAKLATLADFEHPLLRKLAARAPGTWAHSLSMANMAEMAANAIGANGVLVRVGAYYHDVGKMAQPTYFIENQSGENPHDQLEPEVSVDAIVSHVEEGVKLARKHKLPEAVIEFVFTHHGKDRLEYFWHKKVKAEGSETVKDDSSFRYHGVPPTSRETGILALCDSVEAAAKSLESREIEDIRRLVRQIVFTKLLTGVLDYSGLTIADLRKIMESMIETLHSSMHVRVKYPWQEKKKQDKQPGQQQTSAQGNSQTPPLSADQTPAPVGQPAATEKPKPGVDARHRTAAYAAHAASQDMGSSGKTPEPSARRRMSTQKLGTLPEDTEE